MSIIQRMGLQCDVVKLLRVTKLFMACMIWVQWVGSYMWQSLMELNMCIDLLSQGWVCSVSVVKLLRVTKLTVSVLSDIDWLCVYRPTCVIICNMYCLCLT